MSELLILCGPSSAGKSTYLERAIEAGEIDSDTPLLLANAIAGRDDLAPGAIVHYNTLRALDRAYRGWMKGSRDRYGRFLKAPDFGADPAWKAILDSSAPKRAIVVLTSERTIWQRVIERRTVEQRLGERDEYPSRHWAGHFRRLTLSRHYAQWIAELKRHDIPFTVVDGGSPDFTPVEDVDAALSQLDMQLDRLEQDELEAVGINSSLAQYQQTALPGFAKRGTFDRTATLEAILPDDMSGLSLLDVGAAEGYFSLEAADRGAEPVHGVDVKPERTEVAEIARRMRNSNATFELRDVQEVPIRKKYDWVLLLNVIHHLDRPLQVLRDLARITRDTLVVEFPGLTDEKFARTAPGLPADLNALPLIGVSSLEDVDQTFVFSPAAIERLLGSPRHGFESVEIRKSASPDRYIAICRKKKGRGSRSDPRPRTVREKAA